MSQRNDDKDEAQAGLSSPVSRRNLVAASVAGGLGMGLAADPDPAKAADRTEPAVGPRGSRRLHDAPARRSRPVATLAIAEDESTVLVRTVRVERAEGGMVLVPLGVLHRQVVTTALEEPRASS